MPDLFPSSSTVTRASLTALDDSGDHQLASLKGHARESYSDVVRAQPHGFTSHPPANAAGYVLRMGESDRLVALGFETPGRPRSLPAGATALYNADGTIWKLLPTMAHLDQGGKPLKADNAPKIRIKAGQWVHVDVEPGGGVYLGYGPPWYPVMTSAGPSQHVFAGIAPVATQEPSAL